MKVVYQPCVLGADGKCKRWSHDHSDDQGYESKSDYKRRQEIQQRDSDSRDDAV